MSTERTAWHPNRGTEVDANPTDEAWNDWFKSYLASVPIEWRLEGISPEELLTHLKPEERLSGLKPEEIARALSPDHAVLVLPEEALRALADDYVATLPVDVQAAVRARRGR
jgi:hypothetical protein